MQSGTYVYARAYLLVFIAGERIQVIEDRIEITNRQLTSDKVFNSETTKRIIDRYNPAMMQTHRQRTWACSHTLPLLSSPWQQAGYIQTDEELLFVVPWGEDGKVWGQQPHVLYTCNERNESTANGNDNSMCLSPLSETVLWSRGELSVMPFSIASYTSCFLTADTYMQC